MAEIGPHLLGRRPTTPDDRDFRADNFVTDKLEITDPSLLIEAGVSELKKTTVTFQKWAATKYADPTTTHWWKALNAFDSARALLSPPIPVPQNVNWAMNDPLLDQKNTNHCGGFGGCHWGNTLPVDDHYTATDAHDLYYEAVKIGMGGRNEDGVESRWVAKALKARGRLSTYAFAYSTDAITDWLRTRGPVMVGTDWTNDMFNPSPTGYVRPTGAIAGGHFYVLIAHQPEEPTESYLAVNSWGSSWGLGGYFRITVSDFDKLLPGLDPSIPADAIVSTELAI